VPAPTNLNAGQLDSNQILQRGFDESTDRHRVDAQVTVTAVDTEVEVEVDAADGDNIAIANEDGSKKVTVTTIGSIEALDVNVANLDITVDSPIITNVSIPTLATEQSFSIPAGTKRISVKIRGNAQLNIAYISGQSGTNYILVPIGTEYIEDNLNLTSPLTMYFQANKNTQVLEIITWS
jgi:hypothetical protein